MNKLSFLPECYIEAIRRAGPGHIDIIARSRRIQAQSPACSDTSRTVHSRYHRHPADLNAGDVPEEPAVDLTKIDRSGMACGDDLRRGYGVRRKR